MVYDPGWDMPLPNWRQVGSYQTGARPPTDAPDSGTLACLPAINVDWLALLQGCLTQLTNPSTWIVDDDDAMYDVLSQANKLRDMISGGVGCTVFDIRFDPGTCQLQKTTDGTTWVEVDGWDELDSCLPPQTLVEFDDGCTLSQSLDGGATYTDVPGWIDNFSGCVQKYTPIIGLPPNPGDQDPDQLACSIATYIAEQVIVAAIGKAVTAISDELTLLQFGLDVVNIIPEFVLVTLAADAFSAIYVAVQEGTLSDFEDALTDATLRADVICAIYACIKADGYVTPGNFGCITTNLAAITASTTQVVEAIASYITALGATGLAQLSQIAGLESGADCSSCGLSSCVWWDFSDTAKGWGPTPADPIGTWEAPAWHGDACGAGFCMDISTSEFDGDDIVDIEIIGSYTGTNTTGPDDLALQDVTSGVYYPFTLAGDGAYDVTVPIGGTFGPGIRLVMVTNGDDLRVFSIIVHYLGARPGGNGLQDC